MEVKAGRSEVQDHPHPHSKFDAVWATYQGGEERSKDPDTPIKA